MHRYLTAFALGVSLILPTAVGAQDHDRHHLSVQQNLAWHAYLKEKHKRYHEYTTSPQIERDDFWKWRTAHPNAH